MIRDYREAVLLTGAGFTKNFGGPLAREMWGIILSQPSLLNAPSVRRILLQNFDFEAVYHQVLFGSRVPFDDGDESEFTKERALLQEAIRSAYSYLDEKLRMWSYRTDALNALNIYKLQDFIDSFRGKNGKSGFVFTLNQDLFLERKYYNGTRPTLPGVPATTDWFSTLTDNKSLRDYSVSLSHPVVEWRQLIPRGGFYYVKLHGSCNWFSEGNETMVIGRDKEETISGHPLLALYKDIFSDVVSSTQRVVCIGYSFSDNHINKYLAKGVASGMRLHIVSPESPEVLMKRIVETGEIGEILWTGLGGYYQYDLRTLFPADQSHSVELALLRKSVFG